MESATTFANPPISSCCFLAETSARQILQQGLFAMPLFATPRVFCVLEIGDRPWPTKWALQSVSHHPNLTRIRFQESLICCCFLFLWVYAELQLFQWAYIILIYMIRLLWEATRPSYWANCKCITKNISGISISGSPSWKKDNMHWLSPLSSSPSLALSSSSNVAEEESFILSRKVRYGYRYKKPEQKNFSSIALPPILL